MQHGANVYNNSLPRATCNNLRQQEIENIHIKKNKK